jgi:PAS domain S-box-containing protein
MPTDDQPDNDLRDVVASFHAMAQNVPGALFRYVLRPDGTDAVEYMSPACIDLWEVDAAAIERDASVLWQMVDLDDRPGMLASVQRSAETLSPWVWEWRIKTPSGKRKFLEGRGRPLRLEDGTVLWNSLILDVTERRHVDEALRVSEERLAQVLEVTGQGVWDWDITAGVVRHNRRWCEMFGIDDAQLEHSLADFERLVHEDDRPRVVHELQVALDRSEAVRSEYRACRADGRLLWIEDHGKVVARDAEGRPTRMVGSMTDITARKRADLQLRIKDAAIESSLNGIALADLDGRLTYVNPAFCRLWQLAPEQALGRHAIDFWRVAEGPQIVIDTLRAEGQWIGELEGKRADGSVFDARVSASLVRGADGEPLCMMGSFVDVTDSRRAQAALERLNQELETRVAERTAELERAKAQAERASHAKSEFLSGMSHELRTPMNSVLGFGQLLELDPTLSPRAQSYVRELLRGGEHLLELINEILDLARIEAGRMRLSLESVALAPVLSESMALVAPLAAAREIEMTQAPGALDAVVKADRMRLKQVLVNLLSNAVKYNRAGGSVRIAVEPQRAERLRVSVEDTGIGIPPEKLSELFQPFHRLGADDSASEGTGIGLVISRSLVELMGGTIGVNSVPGDGTVFWIDLPLAESVSASAIRAITRPPPGPAAAGARRLILYVDDNPANLKLMAELIGLDASLELVTAHTASLGLELARAHRPALIMLDLQMPGLDGFQLLERLRADPRFTGVPVMAVTGLGTEHDVGRGHAAGFDAYIVKPFVVADLLRTLATLLASSTSRGSSGTA